ncbi:restriction endonuclease subunit S [Polaromonas sp. SM01]|uniref:restriction endonuclease subunit S n=1 Tax=Polaromonas sp. SM01 TaxID=3085630 RepID=UPI002980E280|nr:restriction endonuclease subunit S [Polaromonas sp. SM01]MDW5443793.1 restriction endonuclease subunit S [Polaromonas sp. SM01]
MNVLANQCEWITRPLIEVATLKRGYDLPVQDRSDGPHPIFAANGTVGFHVSAKCRGPGVVTGRSGTIGKVHFVESDFWPLNTSLYVTDFHGNDPKWVYYMLQSFGLERFSQGAGVPTLNRNLIHGEPIRVPTVPEQRRIAAMLDQADVLRAKRREALAQLDSLTQSIFIEMFGDPVRNERGWPLARFGDVGTLDRGVSKHRPRNAPELLGGSHPLVQTGEVSNCDGYIRDYTHTYSDIGLRQSKIWPAGTLCITIAANIAKTGILTFDACFPDSVVGFRADDPATVEFVRVWLSFLQKALEDSAPESAQKNINLAILRGLDIPTPSLPLQQSFATRIQTLEALKSTHRTALQELDRLFASLQHRAFRGEL